MDALEAPQRSSSHAAVETGSSGTAANPVERVPDEDKANADASPLREIDRLLHAMMGGMTLGISPASLLPAWQDWALHLAISPGKQIEAALKAFEKWNRLSAHVANCASRSDNTPCISPLPQDRRFRSEAWQEPPFSILQQSFLLTQQWWHNVTVGVPGVAAKHEQLVEFYSRQLLDTVSPSNFPITNPDILRRTLEHGGANLVRGLVNLAEDTATAFGLVEPPEPYFKPGGNVAVTPGDIVFRNDMIELIRYRPAASKVLAEPLLLVPAWIMKYYILDLSPHNSLVRYLVERGFEVFCISWRNPGPEQRDWSLDDYRLSGLMAALDVVSGPGRRKVHAAGYCLGGTLLAIAAAAMARDGDDRLRSVSLLASLVDFDEPGEIGLYLDESQVAMLDDVMWAMGYLDQRQMSGAFQMLRSRDLIWSRMVRVYLMGEREEATDLMAWNADATRMPYRMHSEYLHELYLANDLARGRFEVDGRTIHLESIAAPVFAVGTTTDHVAPWRSVFKLAHLLDTDVDFILTNGGHNAGIVSEPGHPGRAFRHLACRSGTIPPDEDDWLEACPETAGSWWFAWSDWLRSRSSGEASAGATQNGASLGPAPGTYVFEPDSIRDHGLIHALCRRKGCDRR
jgi:polyhydroxyalkanoate synthase